MEEVRLSTRLLLVSALLLLVILLTAPLGYKYSLVALQPSLSSLLIAAVGGVLVFVVGAIYAVMAIRSDQPKNRNLLLVSMLLGLAPMVIMAPWVLAARSVPPIHDITTDPDNPPAFVALKALRADAPNGSEYGASAAWPADRLAQVTRESYPDVQPVISDLAVADAVGRAQATLVDMGLEIVAADKEAGIVEATATTFWFGFQDDVVVRVLAEPDGSRIDLRSMSRIGQSDLGANAARIMEFAARF